MNKRKIIMKLLLIVIVSLCLLLLYNSHIKNQKHREKLIEAEKSEIYDFLMNIIYEEFTNVKKNYIESVILTNENNVYELYYDSKNNAFSYYLLLNGEDLISDKIISIQTSVERFWEFNIFTENSGIITFSRYLNQIENTSKYDGVIPIIEKDYSDNHYYYYKNYSNLFVKDKVIEELIKNFEYYDKETDSHHYFITYKIDNNISMYDVIITNENAEYTKIEDQLNHNIMSNVKMIKYADHNVGRIGILTNDGYIYSRGIFGTHYNPDSDYDYSVYRIGDMKTFELLELENIQGEIIDFSSNQFYDIYATETATYFYGIEPSNTKAVPIIGTSAPFEKVFKELLYNGESVVAKSIYCQDDAECFIQTEENEILFIGFPYYSEFYIDYDPIIDELNKIDYSIMGVSNDEIDFDRSLRDDENFIFTKDGDLYYHLKSKRELIPVPKPEYFLTYEDYLAQRKREYIDEIDQSIIDEYYESIKSSLPKSSNVEQ